MMTVADAADRATIPNARALIQSNGMDAAR